MLRSLPSRKPSSLEDIDLKEKKGSRYDKNNNGKMIPPPVQTRTSASATQGKVEVNNHPLNDLYQIIHQPPALAPGKGTSGSVKVDSFALHTFVDETGKWVKFRLYGMVEQTVGVSSSSSVSDVGLGAGKKGVKREVKTEMITRVEAGPKGKRKRVTSSGSISVSTSIVPRVKAEEEASETEDELEHLPALDQLRRDQRQTGNEGVKQEVGVGLWKGYLRLSKIQNPHTPQSIRKSILDGLIHVQAVPGRLPAMSGGSDTDGGESDVKLIISYPNGQTGQTHTPQIVGCQFSLLPVQADIGQGVWGEEGLKGWWEMGCKMISAYNRTSAQIVAVEAQKTRPLPSSTPPSSAGQVPTLSQMAGSSQDRPGLTQRGSGVKADPTYEDYLGLVKEISMLKMENRQLAQENSALKGGYAGKLSLSQQQQAKGSQSGAMPTRGQMLPGMSKIQPGIRRPPKIETGFASSSDED